MRPNLLSILVCPACRHELSLRTDQGQADGRVITGRLTCSGCRSVYPIDRGIPRFVESHPADASFGFQWNRFRREQLDSANGASISARRLWSETGWSPDEMRARRVLDVGCGAGRFLEVLAETGCEAVGVDVSSAIDAAAETVRGRTNVNLVQADVYHLPFRDGVFDDCYFIGVAQHTPDPVSAIRELPRLLRAGGRFALSMYERRPWTRLNGKYLMRPVTRRMDKQRLLAAIKGAMPLVFPVSEVLFRVPIAGRVFAFFLPVANYVGERGLSYQERYQLAVLDTFDRLAPQFDLPLTLKDVLAVLDKSGVGDVKRLDTSGVNVVGRKVGL